jgi:WD40 repeat protein/tRNA A-37 threonylcarbamoyl transferase component Bud32
MSDSNTHPLPPSLDPGEQATLAPSVPLPAEPDRPGVAGYEVLGELGRGGMGVVYKARQKSLNRTVALKMILAGGHAGADELLRFRREAEAVARLQHPNIVQIYEVGEQEGRPYFSLEYVSGGSLASQLNGTPLPTGRAAELVATLARAMHAAHEQGIVHRDLKPVNVLLTADGTPKITDFGLAKQMDSGKGQTQSGSVLGTPSYMAPEQAGGKTKEVGPPADVYALGALLYECLTGRPPFRAETPLDTLLQVVSDEPVPPSRLQPKLSRDLETICLKCLQKEARQRYASAAALADDLDRFRAGEPITARPLGRPARLWRWCKRKPALASLYALLLAVALGIIFGFPAMFGHELELRLRAEANAREARHNEELAVAAKTEADRAHQEADAARRKAEDAVRAETAERQEKEARLYLGNIALAHSEWQLGNASRPGTLLAGCPAEFRSWDWHYVQGLLRPELLSIQEKDHALLKGLAFSPDGRRLATASRDGKVRIWDAQQGQLLHTFHTHTDPVPMEDNTLEPLGVALSADGRRLATAGEKNTVKVLDAESGQVLHVLKGHTDLVLCVAFSPDGGRLASGSRDRTVRIWSPGREGNPIPPLKGHTSGVSGVAFSPDGRRLASAGLAWDGTVKVWDARTGKIQRTCRGHTQGAFAVAFSPDGRRLASTGGHEGLVRIWDPVTGLEVQRLPGHVGHVVGVAFSPDGRRLASTGFYQMVKVWDVATWQEAFSLRGHDRTVVAAAFRPDGRALATGDWFGGVKVWDVTTNPEVTTLAEQTGAVSDLALSPDGRQLAVAYGWGTDLRRWDVQTGEELPALPHPKGVPGVTYSPDGKHLATGCDDNLVRLWNVATGEKVRIFTGHGGRVNKVVFSRDGKQLASASEDKTVRVWDPATGQLLHTLTGHAAGVMGVAFRPDGGRLATAGGDQTLRIWDAATGAELEKAPHPAINGIAYSPDGKHLAMAGRDNWVRVWEVGTRPQPPPRTLGGHTYGVSTLAFSPDGKRLATGGGDALIKVWDVQTGLEVLTLRGHTKTVERVIFSPDGHRLASGGEDGAVRLWEAEPLTPSARREQLDRRALAWHYREGRTAGLGRQPFAARFHLDRLIAARPTNGLLRLYRTAALAELGEFEAAAEDAARAAALLPMNQNVVPVNALMRLVVGDMPGYRKACALMLLLTAKYPDQQVAVAGLCCLAPDAVPQPAGLVAVARKGVQKDPGSYLSQVVLGMALYRAGKYEEAVAQLRESMRVQGEEGLPWDWLCLAMAHHRLGRTEEARAWLTKATRWLERMPPDVPVEIPEFDGPDWILRLAFRILRREAESLILETGTKEKR